MPGLRGTLCWPTLSSVEHLARSQEGMPPASQPQFKEVGGSKGFVVILVACVVAWLLYQVLVAG